MTEKGTGQEEVQRKVRRVGDKNSTHSGESRRIHGKPFGLGRVLKQETMGHEYVEEQQKAI